MIMVVHECPTVITDQDLVSRIKKFLPDQELFQAKKIAATDIPHKATRLAAPIGSLLPR
jgi:hypothetical protein